ncbi:hypothetical protein GHT06_012863 [Daphnia sinensis]|uniref:Uncharacterized protein n=1 Tax=Daphnia sinensis TaxID=1820382 RepID=A0AAD5PW31_9CRUS|nr:hypothetical protein GHT06_012863 [Daphnia sinensis]
METFAGNAHPRWLHHRIEKGKSLMVRCLNARRPILGSGTAPPHGSDHEAGQRGPSLQLKKKGEQNAWQPTG